MSNFDRAVEDGLLLLSGDGKSERVTYTAAARTERWSDPEEKVRAQSYADLVYRYGYPAIRIGVEVVVPDRTPHDAADLVVFHDDNKKRPYAIIECKRDDISDAEFMQAIEQACGNGTWSKFRASYVGVVAGNTRRFLDFTERYGVLEREANIIADLPREYGKPQDYKYKKGGGNGAQDLKLVNKEALKSALGKCHQTLWGGGKLSPPTAFSELCKIIFVKNNDEKKTKRGEPYQIQIRTHEPAKSLADRVRALYEGARRLDPEVFAEPIRIDDTTLRTVVSHIEGINLIETDLDTKGVAFELFLDGFFKGDFGQYFTPREVIDLAVHMMEPCNEDLVLDPACGSGGFLLHALDFVRHQADAEFPDRLKNPRQMKDWDRYWGDFARECLFGIEINEEIARVAKMNMIIHEDGHTNIVGGVDALDPLRELREKKRALAADKFDIVLTNPPFGAMVKESEKGKGFLDDFEIARYAARGGSGKEEDEDEVDDQKAGKRLLKTRTSIKSEILFCERVWQFLKPKVGRAAIVLPDGILTNASLQGVRDWLMERFQILAIISLPQAAFNFFGAGVKASVVLLRKRAANEVPNDNEVTFMADPSNIGYDGAGRPTFEVIQKAETRERKTEIHRCDLFDTEVILEWSADLNGGRGDWTETRQRILPDSGLLGQYRAFKKNPRPFIV